MNNGASFFGALRQTVRAVFANDPPDKGELFRLAKLHHFDDIEEMLRKHPQSWYVTDESGNSLLHWASLGGNDGFVAAALAAGVSCDVRGGAVGGEQTPLMWAVCGCRVPVASALLNARADPWARETRTGATALLLAVQQDQLEPVPLLVDAGGAALLSAGDRTGCTVMHWAAYAGNLAALTMLESLGASLTAVDANGMSPLHHSVRAYRPEVMEFLVERGADPMVCTSAHKSCVDIAEELLNPGMLKSLLAAMLKRLLAEWPSRNGVRSRRPPDLDSSPSKSREDAEASLLRQIVSRTPLSFGACASWADAWAPVAGSPIGSSDSSLNEEDADGFAVVHLPSTVGGEADAVAAGMSFDLDYVDSTEKLRQALAKRVHDQRGALRQEILACFVVMDRHGKHVDLLSQSRAELPATRFPVTARLVGLREAGSNDLAKLRSSIDVGASAIMRAQSEQFWQRTLTRIPATCRWTVWKEVLRIRERGLPTDGAFSEMAVRENEWSQLILNDIGRTFTFFDRQQQESLQRILNAYAVMNPTVGYCQGMNMIGGLLLLLSDSEEECFGVLVCLMDDIGLADFYRDGFPLLREYLAACDELMAQTAPALLAHFAEEGVELNMYLQQWFLTLFIDCLPLPLVITIWDAIICEGLPAALRVVVTILTSLQEPLLAMHFQEIATSFKTMRKHMDRRGEWKAFEAGHLLVRQAAQVEVPARILELHQKGKKSAQAVGDGGSGLHDAGRRAVVA